jgi:hypothetical protein
MCAAAKLASHAYVSTQHRGYASATLLSQSQRVGRMSHQPESMTPRQLFEVVVGLRGRADDELLRTVAGEWPAMESRRATPEDAETCRLAMLAAMALSWHSINILWQARAYVKFLALDWREGVASVVMTNAFRLLAIANDNYPQGRSYDVLHPAPEAVKVLEALRPFAIGPGSGFDVGPTPALVARFIDEKSGFLLTLEKRWDEAEAAYDRALAQVAADPDASGDPHGKLRVQLGRELVRYLRESASGGDGRAAAAATAQLVKDNEELLKGHHRLSEIAGGNASRMLSGRADVLPYELL